jgi:hypothetical protein
MRSSSINNKQLVKDMKKKISKKINRKLFLILLFALFLRAYFYVGPNLNDDIDYIFSANQVAKGDFYPIYGHSINALRSMMTLPIAFFFKLFGPGEITSSFYPILCSLLTIIVCFYLGKILVNEKVGLYAALLLSFFPLDIAYSTQLVPTTPLTLFLSMSLLFFIKAEKENKRFFYFISGVFIGIGYLANELFFVGFILLISYIIFNRKIKSDYVFVFLGALLIFFIETTFLYFRTGDPFHRINVIHETERMIGTNTALDYYPRVVFKLLNINFEAHEGNLGIFFYLFLISSLYALSKKNKRLLFITLWVLLTFLYLEFGIMTAEFKPIAKWVRYLIIFGPSFSILIAYAISNIRKIKLQYLVLFLIFISSLPYTYGSVQTYRDWTSMFKEEYIFLKSLENKTIYTDQGSLGFLMVYFNFKKDIRNLEFRREEEIKDAYVIVDGSVGVVYYTPMRERIPRFVRDPPKNWKLIKILDAKYIKPKIYYVE